jgi:hypothetical protein
LYWNVAAGDVLLLVLNLDGDDDDDEISVPSTRNVDTDDTVTTVVVVAINNSVIVMVILSIMFTVNNATPDYGIPQRSTSTARAVVFRLARGSSTVPSRRDDERCFHVLSYRSSFLEIDYSIVDESALACHSDILYCSA